MSQERDPRLGDIGDLEVENKGRRRPAGEASGSGKRPPRKSASGAGPGGQGPWIAVSLALLALMLVMGVYFYREVSTLQGRVDERLSQSTRVIDNLESQLSATDESLSQSANTIDDRLDLHMDEIRKLWDVSNKRNKDWIQENQRDIKALQSSTDKLEKAVSGFNGQIGELKQQLKAAGEARERMQTRLNLMVETVQQLEDSLAAQRKSLEKLEGMRKEFQGMESRLRETEAAIKAFDAWRREVNNRLQQLESGQGGA